MQESIDRNRNRTARTFNAPTDQQAQALDGQRVHANGNDTVGNGFFGHLKDSADAGFFNTIGGAARFAGYHFDSETFNQIADWANQQAEYNTADPSELTGANYIANAVGNAVGSSAASLLGGAVAIGAAKTLGLVVPAAKVAAVYRAIQQVPALGRMVKASRDLWTSNYGKYLLTNVAGSPMEAASEAGNLIDEMRAKGYTNDEIRAASLESAAYNTGWLTVANMLEGAVEGKIVGAIGKTAAKEGLKSIAKQSAKVGVFGGASEGIEEYGQSLIGNIAKGEELDHDEASAAALQGAVGGLFLGGLRGGIDAYANNYANKTKEATTAEDEGAEENIPQIEPPKVNVNPEVEKARKFIIDYRDSLDDEVEYGRLTDILEYGNDNEILEEAKGIRNATSPKPEPKPVAVDEGEVGEDDVVSGEVIDSVSLEPPVIKEPIKTEEPTKTQEPTTVPPKDEENEYTTFRHTLTADAKSALERIKKDGAKDWGAAYNEITEPINKAVFEGKLKEEDAKIIKDWIGNAVKQIQAIHNPKPAKTPWQTATTETATIRNGVKGDNASATATPTTKPVKPTAPAEPKPPKPVEPKPPKHTEPAKPPKPVEPVKPVENTPVENIPPKPTTPVAPAEETKRDKYGYAETLGKFNTVEGSGNGENTHFYATKDNKVQKVVLKTTGGAYVVNTATIDNDGKTVNRYAAFKTLSEAEDAISTGKNPKGNKLRAWTALVKDKKTGKETKVIEAYESISDLVKEYEGKGYEILVKSTAETFNQKLVEYKNKQSGGAVKNTPKDDGDIKRLSSEELNEVRPYEGGKTARQHVVDDKLTQEITDKLIEVVSKKTGLLVITDANKALSLLGGTKYKVVNDELKTQKGRRVLGFYHPVLNFFYIQTKGSDLSAEMTVHEFTHWWNRYVAQQKPILWQKGIELLKKTKAWNNVRATYTDLKTDDEIANEVLAQLSGYNFQQTLKNLENQGLTDKILQKLKLWFKKYWETVKGLFQSEDARVANMTLEEFVNMPLVDLLKDLDVSAIKPAKQNGSTASTGNQSSNLTADVVSRKFDVYVRALNEQTKKILEKPEVKEEVIAMCLGNPKIEHNKEGSKNLYRVTYTDANGKVIQKNVGAAIHHAVGKIAGVKSTKYEKKAPATTISKEVIDKIRGENDVSDFAKSREIRVLDDFKNLGFGDRVDAIEDVLTIEMTDGVTLREELHEVVIKELPLVGKDNFDDTFMDFEEAVAKWLAEDYGLNELESKKNKTKDDLEQIQNIKSDIDSNRNILQAYYQYLINKYNTSGVSPDFLIEPVSEEHSDKIKELEQRLANKESRLKIWRETGWYKAKDGRWKYIITDNLDDIDLSKIVNSNGELKVGTETTVGELYNNPDLYGRFPYLKDIKIKTEDRNTKDGGHYDPQNNTIVVRDAGENVEWYKRVLVHELEHAIQAREGMARGSDKEKIISSVQKTMEVMRKNLLKYSDEASEYFEDASRLMLDEFMLYGGDFKAKKEEVEGYKEDFYAVATPEEIKDVERYLAVLKNNLKNMEDNEMAAIGDSEFADTLTYMNTLGEEEARMAMYFTKEKFDGLSAHDKELAEKVAKQIEKLPKKVARFATKFIYDSSNARSDIEDWKFSEYELKQHPKGQALLNEMMKAENKANFFDSLVPLHFIMGHDDHSVIFLGDGGKVYTAVKDAGIPVNGTSIPLYQAAYHGSPHIFDEFSLEHIGSGEGAQVHGWGLYFAQDETIAKENYRDRLSSPSYRIDASGEFFIGKWFMDGDGDEYILWRDKDGEAVMNEALAAALDEIALNGGNISKAIAGLQEKEVIYEDKVFWRDAQKELESGFFWNLKFDFKMEGSVFEVEIPDNESLLDEQKKFKDQPLFVQEKLKEIWGSQELKFPEKDQFVEAYMGTLSGDNEEFLYWQKKLAEAFWEEADAGRIKDGVWNTDARLVAGAKVRRTIRRFKSYMVEAFKQATKVDAVDTEMERSLHQLSDHYVKTLQKFATDNLPKNIRDLSSIEDLSGKGIYEELKKALGRDKEASLLLNKYGIKGITYYGHTDGRCYVIFDDAAIEIKRRYELAIQKHKEEMAKVVDRNEKELRQALANGKFERLDSGDYLVTMPNGAKIVARTSGKIILNNIETASAKEKHNLKTDDIVIRGSWQKISSEMCDGLLKLTDYAKRGTAFHEAFHAVWDLALSQKEKDALLKHFEPIAERQGKNVQEVMADAYAAWMRKSAIEKNGTRFAKLWRKIVDQAKRLQAWFTGVENVHNVMRRIELGEVWEQPVNKDGATSETHYSASSVENRLRKAVTTHHPTDLREDIEKAGGKKGWLDKQWRRFYRAWVDKNVDIKDLDEILSGFLGRALKSDESIYDKVQMANSTAAGVAHGLIEGDSKHLKSLNKNMKKPMKHTNATLANVLDIVNAEKMNKIAPDYLAKFGKGSTWVEAFGTYLGWRRLAEMAKLKRIAFAEEHAEWEARNRAFNEWVANGKIGDNPQVAAYKEWEAFEKRKRQLKRQWEKDGKTYPNPVEELEAKWLETHKDLEAPKRYVGKEPEFEPYEMPENLTEQEVRKAIQSAPAQFAEAAKLYYQLNDNLLCVMEDAGMIDSKLHELLNSKYKEYCPMVRDFSDTAAVDEFVESITNGGSGVANVSTMLKKIREEGSKRTVINPLESTLKTIAAVTNRAERNKAGQHLVKMMTQSEDLNGTIRKLQQPKHGTIAADPKNCIFTVMFNGKKTAYQADPEYYQAIVGYNLATSSLLMRIPQTVARTLRTGATMSPSFIVRNIFRDTITAGIASSNGFVPIVDTIRGGMELWRNPEFRAQFESAGIVNFNQYGDAEHVYKNLNTLNSGKNYTVYEPMDIIKGVFQSFFKGNMKEALKTIGISFEQLSSFAESATRAGEFRKALNAGKSTKEAAYDAKEVTIDFSRSGIVGQEFNRVIPFFNACIQGGDKMVRLFHSNPKTTSLRVAQYILLPSLALWLMNYDEDWYEELEPSVKYTHWCLPNGVRVPKPQEYGVLFGGGLEAMLDQAVVKDARAMKEWADAARDAISPSILPTVILPLIEWVTNYSFFKGRDLVPQRLQRMPDELQYSSGTSEASKFIGKMTLASPVKIDNLVRGYTGTMGMFLWQTPDWFAAEKQNLPAKKISEMQFIRDFNITQAVRNRYVNDFYELQTAVNQQHAGYGKKGKPSAAVKAVRNAGKIINDLNTDIRTITDSPKYTPERKREMIDKKMERINNVAKLIVKKYGKDYL